MTTAIENQFFSPAWAVTGNAHDEMRAAQFQAMRQDDFVRHASLARSEFLTSVLDDPRRDVEEEVGYPLLRDTIGVSFYRQYFDRDALARRAIEVLPKEAWQVQPKVYEKESASEITEFEEDWDNIGKTLATGSSWYQDEEGSPVWEYLLRADIVSGIGHFGIIMLGIDDGKNYMDPVDGVVPVVSNSAFQAARERGGLPAHLEGYLTPAEEKALNELPNLNDMEKACIDRMAANREHVVGVLNAKTPFGPNSFRTEDPTAGSKVNGVERSNTTARTLDGKEVPGTEGQYHNTFGMGMPGASPMGTDQQYMGIQFGASEEFKDKPSSKKSKLLFLRVFDESLVQIVRYEWNVNNPRFGQPVMYRVTLNDPREQHTGIGLPMATIFVHWSRIIHIADNLVNSEIFGTPRLRPILNNIIGAHKIYAADPEAHWKNCLTKLILSTHPQMGGDVKVNRSDLRNQMENYINSGTQGYLALLGMSATTVTPAMVDPTPHLNVQIEAICICLGIPVRVFKGSERGELASSQDDASWNDRLGARQWFYITPKIIVRFIDRLIQIGVLRPPKEGGKPKLNENRSFTMRKIVRKIKKLIRNAETDELEEKEVEEKSTVLEVETGYSIEWPDLDSLSDIEKANVLNTRVTAYGAYKQSGLDQMIPEKEFMTKFDDIPEEEADAILEAAEAKAEEEQLEAEKLAEEHGMVPAPPPGFEQPQPEAPPGAPIKLGPGQTAHPPEGGKPIAQGPPIPPRPPARNTAWRADDELPLAEEFV